MSLLKVSLLQLKRKKFRTVILIVSVMLALSLLIGLNAGVDGMQKTYYDFVGTSLGYTDVIIESNSTGTDFNAAPVESILKDSVASYSPRVQHWMPYASPDGYFNGTNSGGYLIGINPQADEDFGAYKVVEGNYDSIEAALSSDNSTCVLGESFAERLNLHAGDTLTLGYYNVSEAIIQPQPSQTANLTVGCIIEDLGRTYWFNTEDPTSFSKTNSDITVTMDTARTLFYLKTTYVSHIYVHLKDLNQAQTVPADLQDQLGPQYTVGNLKATMYESIKQNFGIYQTVTYIIGGMALLIAAMLLLNTMLANVSERKREIGILRSVGASRGQVFGLFIAELVPIAVAGALASIPMSMVAAKLITSILPAIYVQNVGTASAVEFSFPLSIVASGIAVGIALTLIVGLLPALLACKVKPVEALHPHIRSIHVTKKMRYLAPMAGVILCGLGLFLVQNGFSVSTSWFPTATALVGYVLTLVGAILMATLLLSPLSWAFSQLLKPITGRAAVLTHRNIQLNFRRSVFSYGAFAISIALLVSFSSLISTAGSYNITVSKQYVGSDAQVWVNAPANFTEQLKTIEGIQKVAGVGYLSYGQSNLTCNGNWQDSIMVTGIASPDFFDTIYQTHLTKTLNNMTQQQIYDLVGEGSGYLILQDKLAQNLTADVGDTVTWSITNKTGTYQQQLQVAATTDFVAGRWETVSNFAEGYYTAIVSFADMQSFRSSLLGSNLEEFYVSIDPSANVAQVRNSISQACRDAGYNPTVYTAQDTLAESQASFDQTELLAVSVTSFFVIVGALGITASTAYTVMERKREIGVLTALGMDKQQNRMIIAGEALLLALIGVVVGFASGLGLSVFAVNVIPWWANVAAPSLVISPLTLGTAVAVIAVSAVLSAVYPASRISKLNTVDALRE